MSNDGPGCYRHVPLQWLVAEVESILFPASFASFSHPRQDGPVCLSCAVWNSVDRQWYLALVFFFTHDSKTSKTPSGR